ncbi:hypothetical protein CDAR_505741 [Caerostris darwini]|uniref:Uncharacterized protein n=1 Tax=Caerostris darwini TaxID=1538125 RepID=A0AAV4PH77_9ARAC|nr:hypothetical protein CDAR_113961 [Caerostris darwini]GIY79049.1 hypothetical protein CDAR_505741 [Caerostris darwini]
MEMEVSANFSSPGKGSVDAADPVDDTAPHGISEPELCFMLIVEDKAKNGMAGEIENEFSKLKVDDEAAAREDQGNPNLA